MTSGKIAVAGATGRVGRHVVDVLEERGHNVVPISRSLGLDVVTGEGLADALAGIETVIDAASFPSPEQEAATEFFTAATRNLQQLGAPAGVQRIVVVSIIGIDHFTAGYLAAKRPHEQAMLAGPIPALILRAAQFHEFAPVVDGAGTTVSATCRTCACSSSPPARSPRRSPTSPPCPTQPRQRYRSRRSPDHARKASSRWRSCWSRVAATRFGSKAPPTRPIPTTASTGTMRCSPDRMPPLPARRSRSGSAANRQTENRPREEEVTMRYLLQNY